jgi:cobalt/nickel transport protein
MQIRKNQGNWLLVLGVIILTLSPLLLVKADFEGADEITQEKITSLNPNYKPWFKPILEHPSTEIETLLFVAQGSVGSGIIGYVIGLYKGRKEAKEKDSESV